MINASIITIGDELLIGQVVDTNSAWMARELNKAGIALVHRVAVGDQYDAIRKALDEEQQQADIILLTGGLGPTADDITKPLLREYFGGRMVVHEKTLEQVKYLFTEVFKRPLLERNLKQAEVPDSCRVLFNTRGTAPGMWFEKNDKVFVSLPGVPFEMMGLMTDQVIPDLKARFALPHIAHRTLVTFGVGESFLAEQLQQFEARLPETVQLAYLPHFSLVRLRLSTRGMDQAEVDSRIATLFSELQQTIQEYVISNQDESMPDIVSRLLLEQGKTLGTAESCTGGYIAHLITSRAGASALFKGAVVSYANSVKQDLLQVSAESLATEGAVSQAVVEQMAANGRKQLGCDYCVAVSGIMGPDGGSAEKPTGTVWIAVASEAATHSRRFHFRFDRQRNMELTAMHALNMVRQQLLSN